MKHSPLYKAGILIVVVVPLVATIFAMVLLWQRAVNWLDIVLLVTFYSLTALGITVGYHRMLTHRSFTPHPVVKFLFLVLGSMALEGAALEWAATHIKHHSVSDREGDPHSPVEGFFHAHIGWLFKDRMADPNQYCRHLLKDPVIVFVSRTFFVWVVLSLVIPFLIGGWTGLLWGGLVRIFLTHHVTWSVNSICHTFGRRDFATNDESRNEWVIGLLSFGEGWHNNHHAFPRSAFHGLRWWQVDISGYIISFMEKVGLVRDVYRVSPEMMQRRLARQTAVATVSTAPVVPKSVPVSKDEAQPPVPVTADL
ncbi:stearoyl-CoA desaturase (delta-9 desaturase) [Thermosporothrix hazakensis]|uniref:Stearoyl-CoA desaturase (Delta-9 desaturase) n=1 Tax=Thermosporothrix hazakensis TaxID=644383 RepID=A0A326UCG4_THEHA|nr:acyl-CoA desaturase [Thermosporothrix hazakensis]PZW36016.1 stearoyl-CoA desaturase (delta-9 desaturase) [Thermosporothrix hazakensis]